METHVSCLGFGVDCGTMFKGIGVVLAGFVLFVGSVYVLLSAVFGRWMGYVVLMTCFAGWMIILSSMWAFGFWAQGPDTKTNLGPRGAEPTWLVLDAGTPAVATSNTQYPTFQQYPGDGWAAPSNPNDPTVAADLLSVQGSTTTFLADEANTQLGIDPLAATAITAAQFNVDSIEFANEGNTQLAVATAHFINGGPQITVTLVYNGGSVPRYSFMFLAGSIVLFLIHLPLLDRAERRRKEFLTGGTAVPWYGPA